MHREAMEQMHDLQEEKETLARHIETLVDELHVIRERKEELEIELPSQVDKVESAHRRTRRELEAKESALQSALSDLARNEALLSERANDIAELQNALSDKEAESRQLGESHTSDRFSLQLEVDRLRRDMEHLESDLKRAREELNTKDTRTRGHDDELDHLHAEKRDLLAQLTAQTQAKLNTSEKLDAAQASLKAAETELASCKQKIGELEQKLSKSQRQLLQVETQSREQVAERNQLLLTVYEDMGKVLGAERSAVSYSMPPICRFSLSLLRRRNPRPSPSPTSLFSTNCSWRGSIGSPRSPLTLSVAPRSSKPNTPTSSLSYASSSTSAGALLINLRAVSRIYKMSSFLGNASFRSKKGRTKVCGHSLPSYRRNSRVSVGRHKGKRVN